MSYCQFGSMSFCQLSGNLEKREIICGYATSLSYVYVFSYCKNYLVFCKFFERGVETLRDTGGVRIVDHRCFKTGIRWEFEGCF